MQLGQQLALAHSHPLVQIQPVLQLSLQPLSSLVQVLLQQLPLTQEICRVNDE
jgi:hypothetical protein